ncbi:uncharacterized protein LOC144425047 isoform X2 [Styela clava]
MKIFLIACLCFMFVATGYAIMCYQCVDCGDNKKLDASQLIECSNSTCQTVSIESTVARSCGDPKVTTTGCNKDTLFHITTETCICKGNACNGPHTTAAATTLTSEPTTTLITELTSSAGTIKSSIIVGSLISLLIAKFIIV